MNYKSLTLTHSLKNIEGTVQLTGSKSESNRALIIQALGKGAIQIKNLSEAADTVVLNESLAKSANQTNGEQITVDIGPAGTAMRFLTSYLNLIEGSFVLTGTNRMQERPIGILVEAMQSIGAEIRYLEKKGFPPLVIQGKMKQTANQVSIPGNISSQYISSLLLIAPYLENGLVLDIIGELTSRPYIDMTLNMMAEAGIGYNWSDNTLTIASQHYKSATLNIEPDWSAASYWYSIVALSENGRLSLPGLREKSLQGDSAIVQIMECFGVTTTYDSEGIHLEKSDITSTKKLLDFKECPDLAQTIVVIAAALRIDVSFTGLETLRIKETDRISALQNEIGKFGAKLIQDDEVYHLETKGVFIPENVSFDTYEDHRMAMALAPLALIMPSVKIMEPQVVEKSYPEFWTHLSTVGFKIQDGSKA